MWLLINVDELRDVGKNEKKRLLLHNDITMDPVGSTVNIVANGCNVHPATPAPAPAEGRGIGIRLIPMQIS